MSYGAGLYGSTLYGAAPGSAGPEVYAPSVSLRVIVCAGQVVTPVVHLRVTVSETYTPTLPLEITVRRPRFAPVVPLSISVFETYTPVLGLAITVTPDAEIPPPAAVGMPPDVWAVRVTLGRITSYNVCYTKLLRNAQSLSEMAKEIQTFGGRLDEVGRNDAIQRLTQKIAEARKQLQDMKLTDAMA